MLNMIHFIHFQIGRQFTRCNESHQPRNKGIAIRTRLSTRSKCKRQHLHQQPFEIHSFLSHAYEVRRPFIQILIPTPNSGADKPVF